MGASSAGLIGMLYVLRTRLVQSLRHLEFVGPLLLRVYLAPIFIAVGLHKVMNFPDIVDWFGNPEWGLGLPFPVVMAFLAVVTELGGGIGLLLGIAVRLWCIPLMITMVVAIGAVHWDKGWFAVAPSNPDSSIAKILAPIGFPGASESLENSKAVGERLNRARVILERHGKYDWLTSQGSFVILNNGIEFAATYLLMLFVLLLMGPGRFFSVDYWVERWFARRVGPV